MRFILQESEQAGKWVCTDTEHGLVCVFEHKNYNDNQKFSMLEDMRPMDAGKLAKWAREMADWLRENHYDKIF